MAKLIDRDEVLEILFPLGVPPEWNAGDWDYCVSARAIYKAVMKCKVTEFEEPKGTSLETVELGTTALRAFDIAGITTVEEVLALSRKQLLSLRRIGPKAADDIIAALEKQGYDCTNLKK